MEELRSLTERMTAEHRALLKADQGATIRLRHYRNLIFAAAVLLNLCFLAWAHRRIRTEMGRRQQAAAPGS